MEGLARNLLFVYFSNASIGIYPMKFRGDMFKTHKGICNNWEICGTPCQRTLWVLKVYKFPKTVDEFLGRSVLRIANREKPYLSQDGS